MGHRLLSEAVFAVVGARSRTPLAVEGCSLSMSRAWRPQRPPVDIFSLRDRNCEGLSRNEYGIYERSTRVAGWGQLVGLDDG